MIAIPSHTKLDVECNYDSRLDISPISLNYELKQLLGRWGEFLSATHITPFLTCDVSHGMTYGTILCGKRTNGFVCSQTSY